ncbi:STAS domain-containing protein [Streptacidiphilus jiangxiensis]|uniref:Anti-sigma factor antagonist n=1 Tax=Streptacidiphilus jiangxiensis TaxID=235985 RepID=A0A1H7HA09_STRJI|nr:STAS domain-containing protein [Streptacidiphilus jiangxiensis]SEK45870.1 stage II sporulation protein AA (anti-sigma F factor antagonist) [Streptacidiphilus jiangxiensis]
MTEQPQPGGPAVESGRLRVAVAVEPGMGVVTVAGELDHDSVGALDSAFDQLTQAEVSRVLLDCRELGFCDSTGLNALLRARLSAGEAGRRFGLVAPGPQLQRLLTVTGAAEVFEVYPDLDTARVDT